MVLSVLLAATTYAITRSTLLRQRENLVVTQTFTNARQVRDSLQSAQPNLQPLLASLPTATSSHPLVEYRSNWTALTAEFSAPSAGPPPWHVYRVMIETATALETVEPGGATTWTF
jgi:hypothetical protein